MLNGLSFIHRNQLAVYGNDLSKIKNRVTQQCTLYNLAQSVVYPMVTIQARSSIGWQGGTNNALHDFAVLESGLQVDLITQYCFQKSGFLTYGGE